MIFDSVTGMPHIEMYRMSENPEAQPVTEIDMMQMFWLCNPKPVTYTNYGLQIEINKQKYHYDVYAVDGLRDESWALQNTGREFTVMYDPMDMTRIELWRKTATGPKYSATATPKVNISRATQERLYPAGATVFLKLSKMQNAHGGRNAPSEDVCREVVIFSRKV